MKINNILRAMLAMCAIAPVAATQDAPPPLVKSSPLQRMPGPIHRTTLMESPMAKAVEFRRLLDLVDCEQGGPLWPYRGKNKAQRMRLRRGFGLA